MPGVVEGLGAVGGLAFYLPFGDVVFLAVFADCSWGDVVRSCDLFCCGVVGELHFVWVFGVDLHAEFRLYVFEVVREVFVPSELRELVAVAVEPGCPVSVGVDVGWDDQCQVFADVAGDLSESGLHVVEVVEVVVVGG